MADIIRIKITPTIELEVSGDNQRDLFERIAAASEIFGSVAGPCGNCKGTNIRLSVREIDGNKYYEAKCKTCGSSLQFGCSRVGNKLFPKHVDDEGKPLPKYGWLRFNKATGKRE